MTQTGTKKILDITKNSPAVENLIQTLERRIVGQPEACKAIADVIIQYQAGMCNPFRPAGTLLFMGMTGTGKTATVEAACEALFGNPRACVKIDCVEFQHSHEIAKLVGSPAGYLGHRETPALLNQKRLTEFHTEKLKLGIVLFDEIEKASDEMWQMLLGVMDKATLTLGDTSVVNFSQSIIVFTSNLGARQLSNLIQNKSLGYKPNQPAVLEKTKINEVSIQAARKHFTPEFLNRIDHTVVFNTLTKSDIGKILSLELASVQLTFLKAANVELELEPGVRQALFEEGYSKEYGARNVKRVLEKRLSIPLARLISSVQVNVGDVVVVSEVGKEEFEFSLEEN